MNDDREPRLSKRQVQRIRKQLRELDGESESVGARIGRIISYPSNPAGNVRRYRFGVALLLLARYVGSLIAALPTDGWRRIFASFAMAMMLIAAWQIDLARKK